MQKRSFDELMDIKSTNSIKAFRTMENEEANKELEKALASGDNIKASKIVAENETEMSQVLTEEIRSYMKRLEGDGIKSRTIRRKVKNKFGIIVVPNHKE